MVFQREKWLREQLDVQDQPDIFEVLASLAKTISSGAGKSLLGDLQKLSAEAKGWALKATADRQALAEEREQFEQSKTAAAADLNKAKAEHDARVGAREVELAAREQRAQQLQEKAALDAQKAAADRQEAARRLAAVELAVSGVA
jgi:hypothetical protein